MDCRLYLWLSVVVLLGGASARPMSPVARLLGRTITPRADPADYRLPQEVIPSNYVITLEPHFDDDTFPFDGRVVITAAPNFTLSTTITQITLNANSDQTINSVTVTYDGQDLAATPQADPVGENELFVVTLGVPIVQGEGDPGTVVIDIIYTGILNTDMAGFFRSTYVENGETVYLAVTDMEPTKARRAFPSFDEPALRATFQANVIVPEGYTALANTAQDGDPVPQPDGTTLYSFLTTPVMSTYLFAVLVSRYTSTVSPDDAAHQVWSRDSATAQRDYAASLSSPILESLVAYTGVPYSQSGMTKMDQLAIPDFSPGAMENWGLVTYRERLLLLDDNETPADYRKRLATVISHEYSHQWFGDLVGPAWWNVNWLNEGFATFFEYHTTAEVETTWRLTEQYEIDIIQGGLEADCRLSTRAMTPPEDTVVTQAEAWAVFDDIAYNKAGSVLRMVSHILGEETWRNGLNIYLNTMQLQASNENNLFDALTQAATDAGLELGGNSLEDILRSWTDVAGFPVVTVTRDRDANTATVSQTRFLVVETTTDAPAWITPLTWATSTADIDNTSPQAWLQADGTAQLLNIPGDGWFVLNNQRSGFYRVQYDAEGWAELTALLQADSTQLPPLTQAQLLNDAFWLARAGQLDYTTALDLTIYLPSQQDYIPWASASGVVSFIGRRLYGGDQYANFQTYVLNSLTTLYDRFSSFEVADDLSHTDRLLLNLVLTWECDLGQASCRDTATQLFATLPGDGTSSIAADVRSVVYCNGVRVGGQTEWDTLWNHYLLTNVASEKTIVLAALGCSTDTDILESYLTRTSDGSTDIRSQDYTTVYASVYNNPAGFQAAANYINNNAGSGNEDLSTILAGLASQVTTQDQADTVLQLATTIGLSQNDTLSLQSTTAELLAWSDNYQQVVGDWLATQVADLGARAA